MGGYTLGIDVGSTTSKCVIMRCGGDIAAKSLAQAGAGTSGPGRAIDDVLRAAGLGMGDISFTVATGYGRGSVKCADARLSELSCHARGAALLLPGARTVIDIGGQDAKALRLGENGALESFVMNDKCAAGTGRFLEVMARVMEADIADFARLAARSARRVDISSTCTVFAESEVISQLAQGADVCDIINGIHRSVAARVAALARRVGVRPPVVMTGGVARDAGVVAALEAELGMDVATHELAQYAGAIGAAAEAFR